MKKIFVIAMVVAAACGGSRMAMPNENNVAWAAQKYPGTTLADLKEGRSLYETNCGKCHVLKAPNSRTEEQWNNIVPIMARKAKITGVREENLILRYVVTMGAATSNK